MMIKLILWNILRTKNFTILVYHWSIFLFNQDLTIYLVVECYFYNCRNALKDISITSKIMIIHFFYLISIRKIVQYLLPLRVLLFSSISLLTVTMSIGFV